MNFNSCDLLQSQFDLVRNFDASVALDYIAEVSDHLLPPNEPNERFFRLIDGDSRLSCIARTGRALDRDHVFLTVGNAAFRFPS